MDAVGDPSRAELSAFCLARVFFAHQSVGDNVIEGVRRLFADAGREPPRILETRAVPGGTGGYVAHTHIGANGDALGKLSDFADVLSGPLGTAIDVALVKLCYADITSRTEVEHMFSAYAETMARLEVAHPAVTFVHSTVPLTTDPAWTSRVKAAIGRDDHLGPADNISRERYNVLVRAHASGSRHLFDIAAVESGLPGTSSLRRRGSDRYHVLDRALAADAGHLNDRGAMAAAARLIEVVAAASAR